MEGLSEADFRRILSAIEILGSDFAYESFPRRAVDAIAAVVDVDLISYNEVDSRYGTSRFLLKPDLATMAPDSANYAAVARRFGNHPVVAQRVSRTADDHMAGFVERLRLLGMVGNCCGQAELRLNIGLSLNSSGSRLVGIALNRSVRDFDDRDAARVELLKPHIVSAYKHAELSADARGRSDPTMTVADRPLTPRESQVLYWVSMGKTNEEVSEIVGARPLTIKKHLEHIYDKLGVPNRTAAARISRGLLPQMP
jgi:DNA-binding CsgD family transcriptional regulator